jgi:hypothetical protein
MRKMKLDAEALVVDSFAAGAEASEVRGTVQANEMRIPLTRITCYGYTCDYQTGTPCAAC